MKGAERWNIQENPQNRREVLQTGSTQRCQMEEKKEKSVNRVNKESKGIQEEKKNYPP